MVFHCQQSRETTAHAIGIGAGTSHASGFTDLF